VHPNLQEADMKFVRKIRIVVTGVAFLFLVGSFLERAVEWQKGLTGDFIVYGQTGGPSPGDIPPGFIGKAIPEVAAGALGTDTYSTIIHVVNSGRSTAMVSGSFFNDNGSAFSLPLSLNASAPVTFFSFNDNFSNVPIAPESILVISTAAAPTAPLALGWGEIVSSTDLTVNTVINIRDNSTGALVSRTGIPPSAPDMLRFVVPRVSAVSPTQPSLIPQSTYTRDIGVSLVNTGSRTAQLNGTLFSAAGQILATSSLIMGPHTHQSVFAHDLFDLSETAAADTFMEFESFSPQWAAAGLEIEGSVSTTIVVEKIE
jgi:hypothetical protein